MPRRPPRPSPHAFLQFQAGVVFIPARLVAQDRAVASCGAELYFGTGCVPRATHFQDNTGLFLLAAFVCLQAFSIKMMAGVSFEKGHCSKYERPEDTVCSTCCIFRGALPQECLRFPAHINEFSTVVVVLMQRIHAAHPKKHRPLCLGARYFKEIFCLHLPLLTTTALNLLALPPKNFQPKESGGAKSSKQARGPSRPQEVGGVVAISVFGGKAGDAAPSPHILGTDSFPLPFRRLRMRSQIRASRGPPERLELSGQPTTEDSFHRAAQNQTIAKSRALLHIGVGWSSGPSSTPSFAASRAMTC